MTFWGSLLLFVEGEGTLDWGGGGVWTWPPPGNVFRKKGGGSKFPFLKKMCPPLFRKPWLTLRA